MSDPMDCSLPGSSVHGILQARITGVGCHALLQGIFLTQGSNPGLLHCRILYCWATGEAPKRSLGNVTPTLTESNIKFSLLRCRWKMCHKTTEGNSSLLGKMKNVHKTIYSRTLSNSSKRTWKPTSPRGCRVQTKGSEVRDPDLTPRFTTYWQSNLQKLLTLCKSQSLHL